MMDPLLSSSDGSDPTSALLNIAYCPESVKANEQYTTCYGKADFIYTVWLSHSAKPDQVECLGKTALGTKFCRSQK